MLFSSRVALRSNETQDQRRLAGERVRCRVTVEFHKGKEPKLPAVRSIAWLGVLWRHLLLLRPHFGL
jgi:hypothetical protein